MAEIPGGPQNSAPAKSADAKTLAYRNMLARLAKGAAGGALSIVAASCAPGLGGPSNLHPENLPVPEGGAKPWAIGPEIPASEWKPGGDYFGESIQQVVSDNQYEWANFHSAWDGDKLWVRKDGREFVRQVLSEEGSIARMQQAYKIEEEVIGRTIVTRFNEENKLLYTNYLGDSFMHRRMSTGWATTVRDLQEYFKLLKRCYDKGLIVGDVQANNLLIDPVTGQAAIADLQAQDIILPGEAVPSSEATWETYLAKRMKDFNSAWSFVKRGNIDAVTKTVSPRLTYNLPDLIDAQAVMSNPWYGVTAIDGVAVAESSGAGIVLANGKKVSGTPVQFQIEGEAPPAPAPTAEWAKNKNGRRTVVHAETIAESEGAAQFRQLVGKLRYAQEGTEGELAAMGAVKLPGTGVWKYTTPEGNVILSQPAGPLQIIKELAGSGRSVTMMNVRGMGEVSVVIPQDVSKSLVGIELRIPMLENASFAGRAVSELVPQVLSKGAAVAWAAVAYKDFQDYRKQTVHIDNYGTGLIQQPPVGAEHSLWTGGPDKDQQYPQTKWVISTADLESGCNGSGLGIDGNKCGAVIPDNTTVPIFLYDGLAGEDVSKGMRFPSVGPGGNRIMSAIEYTHNGSAFMLTLYGANVARNTSTEFIGTYMNENGMWFVPYRLTYNDTGIIVEQTNGGQQWLFSDNQISELDLMPRR